MSRPVKPDLALDIVTTWATAADAREQQTLAFMVGLAMHRMGEKRLRISEQDMVEFARSHAVTLGPLPPGLMQTGFEIVVTPRDGGGK